MGKAGQDQVLRLGTRGSMLAQRQSRMVADQLEKLHTGLKVELVLVKTTGDAIADRPLHEFGGKGLFTKELENALLAGEVDFAVHSFKDVPVTMPLVDISKLTIAAVPPREDPRDVLVSRGRASVRELPPGARVGSSSLRRRAQLLEIRPDLKILPLRGNIDTRIRKLLAGEYEAVVLALAGLRRGGVFDDAIMRPLEIGELLPAAAQGALAIQCRLDDARTRDVLEVMDDPITNQCVSAERAVVAALGGDCHSPIAALASIDSATGQLALRAAVGGRGGTPPLLRAQAAGPARDVRRIVETVANVLRDQGVDELLNPR